MAHRQQCTTLALQGLMQQKVPTHTAALDRSQLALLPRGGRRRCSGLSWNLCASQIPYCSNRVDERRLDRHMHSCSGRHLASPSRFRGNSIEEAAPHLLECRRMAARTWMSGALIMTGLFAQRKDATLPSSLSDLFAIPDTSGRGGGGTNHFPLAAVINGKCRLLYLCTN